MKAEDFARAIAPFAALQNAITDATTDHTVAEVEALEAVVMDQLAVLVTESERPSTSAGADAREIAHLTDAIADGENILAAAEVWVTDHGGHTERTAAGVASVAAQHFPAGEAPEVPGWAEAVRKAFYPLTDQPAFDEQMEQMCKGLGAVFVDLQQNLRDISVEDRMKLSDQQQTLLATMEKALGELPEPVHYGPQVGDFHYEDLGPGQRRTFQRLLLTANRLNGTIPKRWMKRSYPEVALKTAIKPCVQFLNTKPSYIGLSAMDVLRAEAARSDAIVSFGYTEETIPVVFPGCPVRSLDALKSEDWDPEATTVVLFHGNNSTCVDTVEQARWFEEQGFNTLCITMGGYPGSPGVATSEESCYQDAEAVRAYLDKQGVERVGWYGFSIGGTLAFQAATADSNHVLKTEFVVADQTIANAEKVAGNMVKNKWKGKPGEGKVESIAKGVGRTLFPKGKAVKLGLGLSVTTNGLNNVGKAALLQRENIPLIALAAGSDQMMGGDVDSFDNFANQLAGARYGLDHATENVIILPDAQHTTRFTSLPQVAEALEDKLPLAEPEIGDGE